MNNMLLLAIIIVVLVFIDMQQIIYGQLNIPDANKILEQAESIMNNTAQQQSGVTGLTMQEADRICSD
jgi:hypothetical protein